ncbi:MAG TPA: hypothetical protein VIG73_02295 [Cerasibacillus sp.]|uniref:hypothetical protein n=1 Tax=Cerasibacillus sp. TaxID=2498711 RepID=UPI002F41D535
MADERSYEEKITTLECMVCGYREVFTKRQFKVADGLDCYVCHGPVLPTVTKLGEKLNNRRMKFRS